MATPALTSSAKYNKLSELYLALWKQLDLASNSAKWLEVRPESASALSEEVRERFSDLRPDLSGSDLNTALKDVEKTTELVFSGLRADSGESVSFREYLRDLALRFAELADPSDHSL
ncbi:MAG: hypothetical protein WBE37_12155 [Bryobacteraceae bacterium]